MPIIGALGNGGASMFGIGLKSRGIPKTQTIDYLIVAGGGGADAGGGGGGGFRTGTGYPISIVQYNITIGAGGSGGYGNGGASQTSGSNSGFWNVSTSLWSTGGGYGGTSYSAPRGYGASDRKSTRLNSSH